MDVVHQEHYESVKLQPIEIMAMDFEREEFIGFLKGNILKYILRYNKKDGINDLKKARIYLDWMIQYIETGRINIIKESNPK